MDIPGLGFVTRDSKFGWLRSAPIALPLLLGQETSVVLDGYEEDERKVDFHIAIKHLLSSPREVLRAAERHVFKYYEDMNSYWQPDDPEFVSIARPEDVWAHIEIGEPMIARRHRGDKAIYISFECNCDWEPEHGLQLVLKHGLEVVKVGPYDGHFTNSDAFADDSLENVVYREA